MQPSLTQQFQGQWRGILSQLLEPEVLGVNKPCVFCGGENRASFTDYKGTGGYYCRRCGFHDPVELLGHLKGWDFKRTAEEVKRLEGLPTTVDKKPDASKINRLLRGAKPVSQNDLAGQYLAARGCPLPSSDVFFQPKAYGVAVSGPCMVALVKSQDGTLLGAHKTFLDGPAKARTEHPKQLTKLSDLSGGFVKLFPARGVVGIGEGIETALSASSLFGLPVWAALNNVLLEAVQLPKEITEVHVFADNDPHFVGQASAFALAKRLAKEGRAVKVHLPTLKDFNEEAR